MTLVRFSSRRRFAPFLVTAAAVLPLGGASAETGKTINVPAHYPTIQEAVDHAMTGDTIQVAGGLYEESVVIANRTSLTIIGSASARIDSGSEAPAILVSFGQSVRVIGFDLVSGGDALRLESTTTPTVQSVHVSSAGRDGIHGHWIEGSVSVTGSSVDQAARDGIHLEVVSTSRAEVTISNNTVFSAGGMGIFAYSEQDRGPIRVVGNTVSATGGNGIRTDCGYAYVETNQVSDTGSDAIFIYRSRSEGVVSENTITNSGGDGVTFVGTPSALVQDNVIRGSAGDGVDVAAPAANILNNTIVDSVGAGVHVTEVAARDMVVAT